MSMGKRKRRARQASMWVATQDLGRSAAHPFYRRLNRVLDEAQFDAFVEGACDTFYAEVMGRPSLTPSRYFRLLLLGYFEGLDSELARGRPKMPVDERAAQPLQDEHRFTASDGHWRLT